jgi:hypothetical protein
MDTKDILKSLTALEQNLKNIDSARQQVLNTVNAYEGDDSIIGGTGNDGITAGNGNNYVETGDGTDSAICGTGNDVIILGAGTKTVNSSKGDDVITLTKSISETRVNLKDSDGNDVINLADNKDNVNIVFKIDKDGNMISYDDIRIIADSDMASWAANKGSTGGVIMAAQDCNGIETIITADGYKITSTDINTLKADVASWLTTNNFADVESVLTSGTDDQVDALMAVFETANFQQIV